MASFKVIGISSSPRIKGQHCLYDSLSAIMLQDVMDMIGEEAEFTTETIKNPLAGKVGAIVVAGSELGQDNAIKEIMLILNLYGFILPPNCFIYHTGHSMQSLEEVRACLFENKWVLSVTRNLAASLTQMVRLTHGCIWPAMEKLITRD